MRCMKKIGEEKAVETFSIIKLESSESFQELEHPRDGDGKFTDKDGGSVDKKVDSFKDMKKRIKNHDFERDIEGLEDSKYSLGNPYIAKKGEYARYTKWAEENGFKNTVVTEIHHKESDHSMIRIGTEVKYYDEDGTLSLVKSKLNNGYVFSEKKLNDDGVLEEIDYDLDSFKNDMFGDDDNSHYQLDGVVLAYNRKREELEESLDLLHDTSDEEILDKIISDDSIRKIGFGDNKVKLETAMSYKKNLEKSYNMSIEHISQHTMDSFLEKSKLDDLSTGRNPVQGAIDFINEKYNIDVNNDSVLDYQDKLSSREKIYVNKNREYGVAGLQIENSEIYIDRIDNEVVTPLINSNTHMYVIPDVGRDDFMNKNKDYYDNISEYAYGELSYMQNKNTWNRDLKNPMNLSIHAGAGKKFTVNGEEMQSGGNWSQDSNTINMYNYNPYNPLQNALPQLVAHELTHSVFSTRERQVEMGNTVVKEQMERLTNISENLDPVTVGKYLGTYAQSYVEEFNKNGRDGYGQNLETEMMSAITDSLNPRFNKMFTDKTNWTLRTLKKHLPELIKVYDELMVDNKWESDDDVKMREWKKKNRGKKLFSSVSGESFTKSNDIIYDVKYLDDDRNIVPVQEALFAVRKGYVNNKLISIQYIVLDKESSEAFVEDEHPRDGDGKFTSGGSISSNSKPNSKAETAQKWQNKNISQKQKDRIDNHFKRNEEAIEKSDYKDLLRKLSDNYPDIMEKISKRRSSTCTYDPKTQSFDDDRAGTEMLCGPSSATIFLEDRMSIKSNIYKGYVKGDAFDNHRRKDEYENLNGEKYIGHMFIEMDDGTIVDGAYGQVYPKEVNINADMRLRIISPDDPDYDNYVKESRNYPFLNKDVKLTKENDFGKNLPKSIIMNPKMLGEAFVEQKHPRDGDGKFTDKDGDSDSSDSNNYTKNIRDVAYDNQIAYYKRKINQIKNDEEMVTIYNKDIQKIEELKRNNEYNIKNLPNIEFLKGKNTHKKNKYGFKTNKTKIRIGDTIINAKFDGKPSEPVQRRMDAIVESVRSIWNELPDSVRDGINKVNIHNVRGYGGTTLGTFIHNQKGTKKDLTIRISQSDSRNISKLIQTTLHEIGHSIWNDKFDNNQEKITKFRDGVNKLIEKYGGITDYVQEDHVSEEKLNQILWDYKGGHGRKHDYAKVFLDSEDMSGEDATEFVKYHKRQMDQIVANETHSEVFSFMLGGVSKFGVSSKIRDGKNTDILNEYFKLVQDLHDD